MNDDAGLNQQPDYELMIAGAVSARELLLMRKIADFRVPHATSMLLSLRDQVAVCDSTRDCFRINTIT